MMIGRRSVFALLGVGLIAPAVGFAASDDAASLWAAIEKRGTLKIGMEGTFPPFNFETSAGKLTGYEVDFARDLCKQIGLKPDFVLMPWDDLLASLATGRVDVVINQVTVTPAREQEYAFSIPYTYSGLRVTIRKGTKGIDGPESLAGKRVGVVLGSNVEAWVRKNIPAAKVVTYQDQPTMLQDLKVGRVAAVVNYGVMIAYANKTMDSPFALVGKPFDDQHMAVAMTKGNTVLLGRIDAGIRTLKADGALKAASERWFGMDISAPQ
ncbi:MAG TPA: transporter substrate-binding domain-containing protein [Acidiphilium sp.]